MFGVSSAELLVIAFIAILIFGPERVPEFFRRAGSVIRGLQDTADDVWSTLQSEMKEVTEPIRETEQEIKKLGEKIISGPTESKPTANVEPPETSEPTEATDATEADGAADDEEAGES